MKALSLFFALALVGCATVQHDPLYDGAPIVEREAVDTVTQVRITIENHRTHDAIDPTLYLVGNGRHYLGQVRGIDGKLDRQIDASWFGPDRCMTIIAHYAGAGDLTFERFCWRPGERIDVSLDNLFNPIAAWSHE